MFNGGFPQGYLRSPGIFYPGALWLMRPGTLDNGYPLLTPYLTSVRTSMLNRS